MEKLKEVLSQKGIPQETLNTMDEASIRVLATAFGINTASYLPREVKFETGKNGAMYMVSKEFSVPKYKDGKKVEGEFGLCRNIYCRVDAIDQIISDLQYAKELLNK